MEITNTRRDFSINGIQVSLFDLENSETLMHLKREVINGDEYNIINRKFEDNDVIIDIGANVGLVSIFLAKKYPNTVIYSFEAHPITYKNFLKNIDLNGVNNIRAYNLAVSSKDDDEVEIPLDMVNTGSSSIYKVGVGLHKEKVKTISLDTIIKNNNIKNISFLKIDCEGSEFDILENSKLIHETTIRHVGIEIHRYMESYGKNTNKLKDLVNRISIEPAKIKVYQ